MGSKSEIQWTSATWNPTRGCSVASPGCEHCYAASIAARFSGPGLPFEGFAKRSAKRGLPQWTGKLRLLGEDALELPLRWRRPRRIFVNSMSDLFHERLSNEQIAAVFGVMAACPQHTFQILTKRAERMAAWFKWLAEDTSDEHGPSASEACCIHACNYGAEIDYERRHWPLPNVHLGVSVESQKYADERIPFLLDSPAAVRFLSCEPLLGRVDLTKLDAFRAPPWPASLPGEPKTYLDALRGTGLRPSQFGVSIETTTHDLDWVICGGESGPKARPCALEWLEEIVDHCRAAGTACFVKQLGSFCTCESRMVDADLFNDEHRPPAVAGHAGQVWGWRAGLKDRAGGDIEEFPERLRVRMFPGDAWAPLAEPQHDPNSPF